MADYYLIYHDPGSDIREPNVDGPHDLPSARRRAEELAVGGAEVVVTEVIGRCAPRASWDTAPTPRSTGNVTSLDRSKA